MANEDRHIKLEVRNKLQTKDLAQQQLRIVFSGIFYGALDKNIEKDNAIYIWKEHRAKDFLKVFRSKVSEDIFFGIYSFLAQLLLKASDVSGAMKTATFDSKLRQEMDYIVASGVLPEVEQIKQLAQSAGQPIDNVEIHELVRFQLSNTYRTLCETKIDDEEFQEALSGYIEEFKRTFISEVAGVTAIITQEGGADVEYRGQTVHMSTPEEAMDYWSEKQSFILGLGHSSTVGGYVYDSKYLKKQRETTQGSDDLFLLGIKEIDDVQKAVMRGHVLAILGPMKGGKTSFTQRLVAKLIAVDKLNVAIWTTDGQTIEWEAGIKASILSNGFWNGYRMDINRGDIMHRTIPDDSDASRYITALETAMANNELGRLSFFTGVSYAENIRRDMLEHYKLLNPYDIFVMDTPVNMTTRTRGKTRPEYLGEGIRTIATVVRDELPVKGCAILTGQLKQEVIDTLRAHPESDMDITAGADTSEIVKTPDRIYGIFTNKLEQANNMTKIHSVAARHDGNFDNFYCGCDLATLRYWSDPSLNT